ncbi:unnamed protein product [Cyprideis torosa]|uniref:Uncharacterized protein n=1 Tax=Cyprideis torosa TaxID=163714 RepID=A0A7R8W4H1_9CRUS|nr:unnamed protein product [Cyprideis torosa]CAG0884188.1 unnamed protein product [Cyprideis torosa]
MHSPNTEDSVVNGDSGVLSDSSDSGLYRDWGVPRHELYRLAVKFYREKHGKAFHLHYQDNISFIAFYNQAHLGQFKEENVQPLGALDVIGRERRAAWQALGDMSMEDAKTCLIDLIEKSCPLFKPYAEAHFRDLEEKTRKAEEAEKEAEIARAMLEKAQLDEDKEASRKERARQRVQDALNAQTYPQFKAYAEQQFPGNPDQQAILIRQLQQQHYAQYMQQLNIQDAVGEGSKTEDSNEVDEEHEEEEEGEDGLPPVQSASMWTRKDVVDFKKAIREEGTEGVIRVGHGETVTVRVPTHEEGTRDCHEEVYAGCHVYPGTGVYLLKFDNSYSLWRSKTLYYRVYYTR